MKRTFTGWLFAGGLALLAGQIPAAQGQEILELHVICCNLLIGVDVNWDGKGRRPFGAIRTCDLSGVPSARRASVCQRLAGCADAAPYCGVDCPVTVAGSIVDVQNQALGERIRVSGTPFTLYYRSDRIRDGRSDSFPNSLAGWSLDVHHAYEAAGKILYTGDGRRRIAITTSQAGGEMRIPADRKSVV